MIYPNYVRGITAVLNGTQFTWERASVGNQWLRVSNNSIVPADFDFPPDYTVTEVDLTGIDEINVSHREGMRISLRRSTQEPKSVWYASYNKCKPPIPIYEHEIIANFLSGAYTPAEPGGVVRTKLVHACVAIRVSEPVLFVIDGGGGDDMTSVAGDSNGPWTDVEIERGQRIYDLWNVKQVGKFTRGVNDWEHERFEVAPETDAKILEFARHMEVEFFEGDELLERAAARLNFCTERHRLLDAEFDTAEKKFNQAQKSLDEARRELNTARQRMKQAINNV